VQRVFELTGADRLVPFAGLVRKERNRGSR
jgi:hypothetical protein